MAGTVAFLSARGVPVMGHVWLTPQAVNALGGSRSRGHAPGERDKIMRDGVAIAEAGAFSLVIEGFAPEIQVRSRLLAGGSRIRTLGPAEDARRPRGCRFTFAPTISRLPGNQ